MNRRPAERTVLFLGTHGQFNVGDELLLETFLSQLGTENRYVVNSYAPSETAATLGSAFDVEVIDTAGDRIALLRHLRSCDVVFFGGGSIVKELYGSIGRWRHATLCMVLAIVAYARLVGRRPVVMSNIGVGPLTTRTGRHLASWILRLASLVSVRDDASLQTCRELGCNRSKIRRVPDAVWANGPDVFAVPPDRLAPDGDRPIRIALNLNRDIENGDNWDTFLAKLAETIEQVSKVVPVEIHALPMQIRFKEHDDLTVISSFFEALDDVATITHRPVDHRDVARIISQCDVVVAERLHAIVMAAILGRATVGLPYDVKVRELVSQLQLDDRSIDVNQPFDADVLAEMILRTIRERENEGQRLSALAATLRRELDDYFGELRGWLPGSASGPRIPVNASA